MYLQIFFKALNFFKIFFFYSAWFLFESLVLLLTLSKFRGMFSRAAALTKLCVAGTGYMEFWWALTSTPFAEHASALMNEYLL